MRLSPPFALVLLLLPSAAGATEDLRPTRAECIVGYGLDWSAVTQDHTFIGNQFTFPLAFPREVRPVAYVVAQDLTAVFAQYEGDCAHKREHGQRLIEHWRATLPQAPAFVEIEGAIAPGPDTIEFKGPAWRD